MNKVPAKTGTFIHSIDLIENLLYNLNRTNVRHEERLVNP
ncbi:MAG: hypothetical protein K0R06_17 [Clostridium sp.]|jgi:hypothetical protein|nr:hypothetical protein [Clostridium sp.]